MFRAPVAIIALALLALATGADAADAGSGGSGKIFCWKNAGGKTECGDRAPQDAQVRQLNQRGVTVNTKDAAPTPEQLKAREDEDARKKVEQTRLGQQQRQDRALLDTFTTEQEIDAKRKRELATIEAQISNLDTTLRNANERQAQTTQKAEEFRKGSGKIPQGMQDELMRIDQEKLSLNAQLARKRKEITELNTSYAALRTRFIELKGGAAPGSKTPPAPAASATPAPAPAPAAPAAPAKK